MGKPLKGLFSASQSTVRELLSCTDMDSHLCEMIRGNVDRAALL